MINKHLVIFSLIALFWVPAVQAADLTELRSQGFVRVGFGNEIPYGYLDEQGRLTGEAPEVARAVFKRLGVPEIQGVMTEFGALIPSLKASRVDVIAAGMYITPRRCAQVAFSEPSYQIGEALAVPLGNPKKIHSYDDLVRAKDLRLGVMAGAVELGYARKLGIGLGRLSISSDIPTGISDLTSGRIDAYAGTALTIEQAVRQNPEIERVEPFKPLVIDGKQVSGYGAFGFKRADKELRDAFDKELKNFLGSKEHLDLVRPFGFTEKELPNRSRAQLCAGR
ncbi:MAG: ectoine/hydroxyectoine ABC transporter substrate-binding protein EhuB [bacterium]|nr:ectoine/hydroxyectoine ABC transporter substrate-binding protein EhuB [bacterium]